ncbi:hypothetical protein Micbo1qcDRAFT_166512 [Microdochium bolleyi]|uniref:Ubiquitin 3 binding protein But2 C-terminal domain-containing protein n=1 Tax=Microdochium bolleyi TaxID=196109 RepID=A0A136IUA4_9PEZI|nr:hypothetical protein Micbo1qcDRAFT_166512 [Microdochium bolleyi]
MKSTFTLCIAALAAIVTTKPVLESRSAQVAHLTFHAGPASYALAVPADGTVVQTSKRSTLLNSSNPSPSHIVHIPASYFPSPLTGTLPPSSNTDSNLNINLIDAPDYNALSQCTFTFDAVRPPALALHLTSAGVQQIAVGPPSVLKSVSCLGACVPTYGMCYDTNGQYVGPCCSGFCAATRCRPWNLST